MPRKSCLTAVLVASTIIVSQAQAQAQKPTKAEIVQLGKRATALVEVKNRGTGSAFCVHSSGLFITDDHVIGKAENPEINLILNPSLKDQRILKAKVIRTDAELDLALLQAENPGDLTNLSLGSVDDVVELMDIIAFGFPFGNALATDKKEYPAVSVNAGSVTSLRLKGADLHRIQMDVALNPGNSGGAIVDDKGKVIGVVVSGITAARINYAIPVSHLAKFLNKPVFTATPQQLQRTAAQNPVSFKVKVASVVPNAPEPSVRMILQVGAEEAREFDMKQVDGVFTATAIPIRKGTSDRVEVNIRYDGGALAGSVKDTSFKVGKNVHQLSEVRKIQFKPKPHVLLADGRTTQEGEITELKELEVSIGGNKLKADLTQAIQIQVNAPPEPVEINATFVASAAKKEIGRFDLMIPILDNARSPMSDPSSVVITPPKLGEERLIKKLPVPFTEFVPGGGGRYLIFHLPKLRKLAIFDVNEARVTGYVPLPEGGILFAAGLEKLVIGSLAKNTLERWNLNTLERETSVEISGAMKSVIMGHASNGPVVVDGKFFDLATLRPLPFSFVVKASTLVSADGTVFAEFYTDSAAGGTSSMWVMEGNELKHYAAGELGHVIPGPDGKTIFTARGLANSQLKQNPDDIKFGYCIPALRGNLFLSLTSAQAGKGGGYSIYALGQSAPIVTVPDANHGLVFNPRDLGADTSRRIFFVPQANLIVLLPGSNDQLVLLKIDIDEILEKSGADYLLVTSQPPQIAKRGETFNYPISVKAKHKNVTYRLDAGPKGMEVTKEGVVSWKVPSDAMEGEQEIILTIADGKGQEIFHTFTLRVSKAGSTDGTQPKPK